MSLPRKPVRTETAVSRVTINPVSAVELKELRALVAAAEYLPDSARVYVEDPFRAYSDGPNSYAFQGMSVSDTVTEGPTNDE